MSVSVRMESNLQKVIRETADGTRKAFERIAVVWHARAVQYLNEEVYSKPIPVDRNNKRLWKRTSRLKSSVAYDTDERSATVGSNVEYAAVIHEGLENAEIAVKEHTRMQRHVFGRKVDPFAVTVKSHTRTVNRIGRPFISQPGYEVLNQVPSIITGELKR